MTLLTILKGTLVGNTIVDTLVGTLSCGTLLGAPARCPPKLTRHIRNERLQKSHVMSRRRALRTRRPPKVTRQVSKTSVSYEPSSKSHASSLQNERFVRDFLKKSRVKSPKRANPKRAFRTRLPQKVTRQVSKTSASYETSSKSHASSLQNERFVRDVLQKSCVNSPKRTFRTRLPPNTGQSSLKNERFVRDFLQKSCVNSRKPSFHTRFFRVSKTNVFMSSAEFVPHRMVGMTSTLSKRTHIHQYRNFS